jgi:hypothetical protein
MKSFQHLFIIVLLTPSIFNAEVAAAQSYKVLSNDSLEEKSQVRIGLKYTSDYLYMGRSDSAKAPYLSPSIGYYHKSGLFLRSSLSYLTTKDAYRVDMMTISGGYDYYLKNLALGASVSQYFFSDLSYNVMAEMRAYLNAYIGYDFSLFTLYGDASVGFSGSSDVFIGAEVSRTFYAIQRNLLITPSIYMNAGSQQYYNEYFAYRSTQTGAGGSGKGKGQGGSAQTPTTTTQTLQVLKSDQFKILDYEAGLNITYKINQVRLFTSSTWTIPVNPATLVNDQGEYEETLKNGFFWSTGIRIIF